MVLNILLVLCILILSRNQIAQFHCFCCEIKAFDPFIFLILWSFLTRWLWFRCLGGFQIPFWKWLIRWLILKVFCLHSNSCLFSIFRDIINRHICWLEKAFWVQVCCDSIVFLLNWSLCILAISLFFLVIQPINFFVCLLFPYY